jgi:predicted DsbA family dithiol-disulfide isomerase
LPLTLHERGMTPVHVTYFSDLLCIWAYVAQARVDEVDSVFGTDVLIGHRRVTLFGDTAAKIGVGWNDRGGFEGHAAHVRSIAGRFPHVALHPDTWTVVRPRSSLSPHLYLSAVAEWEKAATGTERLAGDLAWAFRLAFFAEARDIGRGSVQADIARSLGIDVAAVGTLIEDGTAHARLAADHAAADRARIEGSPTFLLNDGRQKLYGNVGFRVLEANIRELLREPDPDQASWC